MDEIIITVTFKAEASFTHTISLTQGEYSKFKDIKLVDMGDELHDILLKKSGSIEFDYIEHDTDIEDIEFDEYSIGQRKYLFDNNR